ncbi:MAG: hypothetical protein QM844_15835 [Planctomycetota bacterium]|nr:hypothetical protein [Planctomycetota bacterium]
MDELNRQVNRARWRLGLQRFTRLVGWCCFATLLIALALVLIDKYRPLGIEGWVWPLLGVVAGGLSAAGIAVVRGRGPIDAAIEVDRRFGLKERVSSTLALTAAERETEIGQALIADAERRIQKIEIRDQFRVAPGGPILLPLVPLVVAFLAIWLSPAVAPKDQQANAAAVKRQVQQAAGSLQRKLIEQRKQAQQAGLEDARRLFDRLTEQVEELSSGKQDDRKEALVQLNDLKRQMESRQQQIGGADQIRKTLEQLDPGNRGPAEEFIKSVAEGDLRKAIDQLRDLQAQVADGKLTDEERRQLAGQLDAMKNKLEDAINQHTRQCQNLQNQINQARQAGQEDEAGRLQNQLNQLRERDGQVERLQEMAGQLGQCSQSLQDGQLQDTGDLLEQLQSDLGALQQQLDEMQMLDEAMDQLCQARDQINCAQCGGVGCAACQGDRPGMGMGPGQGSGDRPEEKTETGFYDTRVKQKIGTGSATIIGQADGPNVKGRVLQEIEEQLQSARSESADPITGQQIPRRHQDHTRDYFNRFRNGGD